MIQLVLISLLSTAFGHEISANKVKIFAVGDIIPHKKVLESAEGARYNPDLGPMVAPHYSVLFENVRKYTRDADISFANLETPIADTEYNKRRPFVFNADFDFLRSVQWAGFNVVSTANNHALDQGYMGLKETIDNLDNLGVSGVGSGRTRGEALKGKIFDVKGMKVGFLGFWDAVGHNRKTRREPTRIWLNTTENLNEMLNAISILKTQTKYVIVSMHWGEEYKTNPEKHHKSLAKKMHEAGADVILGHHPHVLQPMSWYKAKDGRTCLTVFSLGNFISNQSAHYRPQVDSTEKAHPRDGMALEIILGPKKIETIKAKALWTSNGPEHEGPIQTVVIDDEIQKINRWLSKIKNQDEKSHLEKTKAFYFFRRSEIENVVGRRPKMLEN